MDRDAVRQMLKAANAKAIFTTKFGMKIRHISPLPISNRLP